MTAVSLLCMFLSLLGPTSSPGICPPVDSKAQDPPLPLPLHKISFHSFLHVTSTSISFIQANHTTKPSTLELGCSLVISGREKGYMFAEQWTRLLYYSPTFVLVSAFHVRSFLKSLESAAGGAHTWKWSTGNPCGLVSGAPCSPCWRPGFDPCSENWEPTNCVVQTPAPHHKEWSAENPIGRLCGKGVDLLTL